jgi:hypothetical protein
MRTTSARKRERAHRALAANRTVDGPSCLVGKGWAWARDLLEARRRKLEAHPDVVGVGLGFRVAANTITDEPVVTIYVRRKLERSEIPKGRVLPKFFSSKGRRIAVDVIEFGGALRRLIRCGTSIGNCAADDECTRGTLGSFAIDHHGNPVAITAMHVVGSGSLGAGDHPVAMATPSRREHPGAPIFGRAVFGTMVDVDAARVDIDSGHTIDWDTPAFQIRGWRKIRWPDDHLTRVRMFGARSGFRVGRIRNAHVALPQYDLADTIIASIDSRPGDSGAAIVDDDGLVLGFLVGHGDSMPDDLRIFSPASLVLRTLRCVIPPRG